MTEAYHNPSAQCTGFVQGSRIETFSRQYGWNDQARAALRHRIQARTSQAKFAELAGMSASNLSHLLNGKQEPGVNRLVAIALALGTTVDSLLAGDGQDRATPAADRLRAARQAHAIASAESFAVAIDCLPVGKDIRNRLQAHVRAHIDLLRSCAGDAA